MFTNHFSKGYDVGNAVGMVPNRKRETRKVTNRMAWRTCVRLPSHIVVATAGNNCLILLKWAGLRLSVVIATPHNSKFWPGKGLHVPVPVRVQLVFDGVDVFALGASLGETSVMTNGWTGRKKKRKRKRKK